MRAGTPRWYCPVGVERPAHVPYPGGIALLPGVGPDVAADGEGGGTIYGGPFEPGEPGWTVTDAGWWVNLDGVAPQQLVRLETHPRILRWATVQGEHPDHWWRVPVLLTPQGQDAEGAPLLFVSAVERVFRGADGWQPPSDLVELQHQLLAVAMDQGVGNRDADEMAVLADLVAVILGLGHTVSLHELIVKGWLTERVLLRVLIAAGDLPGTLADRQSEAV